MVEKHHLGLFLVANFGFAASKITARELLPLWANTVNWSGAGYREYIVQTDKWTKNSGGGIWPACGFNGFVAAISKSDDCFGFYLGHF